MIVLSTGPSGVVCNPAAWQVISAGASALDAIQAGLMAAESDPDCDDIGLGGRPDASGRMSLDAALMDGKTHRAGAVAGLRNHLPVAVARRVMEATPHVFLIGQDAEEFALQQGFPSQGDLLTTAARDAYRQFLRGERKATFTGELPPTLKPANTDEEQTVLPFGDDRNSHDTIGCCALDAAGNLAVGTSTSGLDFKLPGRVGDSPIIGSGLYVENSVGAASCFGMGEQMMQVCLAFRVVALMEQGRTPGEACAEGIRFLISKRPHVRDLRCCVIALSRSGATGGAATSNDFYYNVTDAGGTVSVPALHVSSLS